MDRAKKSRKPIRQKITKLCNAVDAELALPRPRISNILTLDDLIEQLATISEQLKLEDKDVKDAMLDEGKTDADMEQEFEDCIGYHNKVRLAIKAAKLFISSQSTSTSSSNGSASTTVQADQRNYLLPKIELPKFSGDLKTWLGWWSQFEKIDQDKNIHDSDKFQYLIQATEEQSEPREMISVYPPMGENYAAAIETLKRRYGREGLQLQVYVRELLNLVINNVTKKEKIPTDKLYLKLESYLRALSTLDLSKAEPSMYFYPLVESSLPEELMRAWLRTKTENDAKKSKLEDLMEFLKKEVEGEQQIQMAQNAFMDTPYKGARSGGSSFKKNDVPTATTLYNGQDKPCMFCDKVNHKSPECFKAVYMTREAKEEKIKEASACFICFNKGQKSSKCKVKVCCPVCKGKHYALMCPQQTEKKKGGGSNVQAIKSSEDVDKDGSASSSIANLATPIPTLLNFKELKVILMKTLDVIVHGTCGRTAIVRLLFDEGSQLSYIKTRTAMGLKCLIRQMFKQQNNLFGGLKSNVKSKKRFEVKVTSLDGKVERLLKLVGEDIICTSIPNVPNENGSWIEELHDKGIHLPESRSESPEIEVLIGSDLWRALMTGRMHKLPNGLIAVESVFGWTLSGPLQSDIDTSYAALTINMLNQEEKSLPDLWSLEAIGIQDSADRITKEEHDLKVMEDFKKNISRELDGRYVIQLPWICDKAHLPSNRFVSEKRLLTTTAKLLNQNMFSDYDEVFKCWEREKLIEIHVNSLHEHFFPHRPVFKPESTTTPVRPVFDASCKVGKNPSLNQCLEKGPNLLELIPSILLRFRRNKIPGTADIRKSLQMIGVAEEDRNFQKFLWWEDQQKKIMKDLPVSRLPEREDIRSKDLQAAYGKVRDIKIALKERFRKEYLGQLIQRKAEKTCPDPVVGDVVLVGSDNRKRFQWPLGRILELLPGKDGKIRTAKIKTASGVLVRPLQRLYPLEVSSRDRIPKTDVEDQQKPERRHEITEGVTDQQMPERRHELIPEKVKKTRSGREVKVPSRYGQWIN